MTAARGERAGLAALLLAAVAGWALVPTYPDYDAYYDLIWGRAVMHGVAPGFQTFAAPTEHPLYIALAGLLSLAGTGADRLLVLVGMLSLAALTAGSYVLGRELFGRLPALLGALCVGSSFALLLYAVRAFVDVPFLALVIWAAALEARGSPAPYAPPALPAGGEPRSERAGEPEAQRARGPGGERAGERVGRGVVPMALLAAAGLLRPEAWVLAGLYWLWCWGGRDARARIGLAALVAVSPLVWALVDDAVTGDPLFSLHATNKLATALGRERGIVHVPASFVTFLADVARPPVALAGVIGLVLAVRRFGLARMAVPIALLAGGALTFVGTGLAGLSIIQRYLTVPAVALCVLAGYAVLGFTTLEPGPLRTRWRQGAIGALVVGAAFFVLKVASFGALRGELRFIQSSHAELRTLLAQPRVRSGMRCGALTFPTYRLVPDARWLLHLDARAVRTRAADPAPGAVAVYITGGQTIEKRFGRADGVNRSTNEPPAGSPTLRSGPFAVYVRRGC
ncbi:MAG TPA: hypothetical protein VGF63_01400 [Solirubrobacteraceae bacterium]